ncbi:hypothetical protein HPB50_005333 [Hyalomma asiaticum]|uniref:Uncharacterized protein n=1 Tax=Hyalomma asiaticum TaxID=266040 RepID=A0ACB7RJL3_HYAAI|nr:hypothetical protein HPB50_005333 [Hyalomma asiaticum]
MRERVDTLSTLFDLFQTARHDFMQSTLPLWQARIVLAYYDFWRGEKRQLIDTSFALTLRARVAAAVDDTIPKEELCAAVQMYMKDGANVPAAALPVSRVARHFIPSVKYSPKWRQPYAFPRLLP